MARRAWETGWKDYPWARPIKDLLGDEFKQARSRAAELERAEKAQEDADREKSRKESIEAMAQEHQVLKVARHDVLVALSNAASLGVAMKNITAAVAEAMKLGPNGEPPTVSPREAMNLLTRHALLMQRAVSCAQAVITLGRLDRGQSTVNLGTSQNDMTYEQALEELDGAVELREVIVQAQGRKVVEMPGLPAHGGADQ